MINTELAFERQRKVVCGFDFALAAVTARIMAGCCSNVPVSIYIQISMFRNVGYTQRALF